LPVVGPEDRAGTELGAHWADGEQQREGDESRREQRAAGVAYRGPCTRLPLGVFLVRSHDVWRRDPYYGNPMPVNLNGYSSGYLSTSPLARPLSPVCSRAAYPLIVGKALESWALPKAFFGRPVCAVCC